MADSLQGFPLRLKPVQVEGDVNEEFGLRPTSHVEQLTHCKVLLLEWLSIFVDEALDLLLHWLIGEEIDFQNIIVPVLLSHDNDIVVLTRVILNEKLPVEGGIVG